MAGSGGAEYAIDKGIPFVLFPKTKDEPDGLSRTPSDLVSEEIRGSNSSHKTGLTREGCSFFINMPKVLSTGNIRLFLNTLPHV
jgi:hypothetical protein